MTIACFVHRHERLQKRDAETLTLNPPRVLTRYLRPRKQTRTCDRAEQIRARAIWAAIQGLHSFKNGVIQQESDG